MESRIRLRFMDDMVLMSVDYQAQVILQQFLQAISGLKSRKR